MNDEAFKYVQNLLGLMWEYFLQKFEVPFPYDSEEPKADCISGFS